MIELNGNRWANYHGALIPDEAPHKEITLTLHEERFLLSRSRAYFLRWTSNWDCSRATEFWHVIKDKATAIEDYPPNTRRDIRRALRKLTVSQVNATALSDAGYAVYRQAFCRYKTHLNPVTEAEFRRGFQRPDPEADYWAAFKADKMIAYAINRIKDGVCIYSTIKLDPEHLKDSSSYALIHTMNEHYLRVRSLKYITDGARSLSHVTDFQTFLVEKFLFRKAYCQLHVSYAPWLVLPVRFLFPFRRIISKVQNDWFCKLAVLLRHEEIRRAFA